MRRGAAVLALGAILACSGLGVCWQQFAARTHDCCQRESETAPARACGSDAERHLTASVAAPTAVVVPLAVALPAPAERPQAAAAVPIRTPQPVLRI
jgi:hypothetical protein